MKILHISFSALSFGKNNENTFFKEYIYATFPESLLLSQIQTKIEDHQNLCKIEGLHIEIFKCRINGIIEAKA